jgi:ABC-type transport system involved in multi-copper enzyme maturation permease subunit
VNDAAQGTIPASAEATDPGSLVRITFWNRLDERLERWGDRLNPILVKEARQALKSRQFTVTFGLLLLCGWGWSLIAVGFQAEQLSYGGAAVPTFMGYFLILMVPSLIIVPFAAFQSLSGERDEGTLDLLSITTLSARQIVRGKLASAVLQLLVYFSALSPCLAFTYLLRGMDILTIVVILLYTFLFSLVLCGFGLMLATLTSVAHLRVMLSGIFVLGLVVAAWSWLFVVIEGFLRFDMGMDQAEFWHVTLMLTSYLISFLFLFLAAAAAQMSFASDNRSTRLRVIMLVQQTLLVGWMSFLYLQFRHIEILFAATTIAGIYRRRPPSCHRGCGAVCRGRR